VRNSFRTSTGSYPSSFVIATNSIISNLRSAFSYFETNDCGWSSICDNLTWLTPARLRKWRRKAPSISFSLSVRGRCRISFNANIPPQDMLISDIFLYRIFEDTAYQDVNSLNICKNASVLLQQSIVISLGSALRRSLGKGVA